MSEVILSCKGLTKKYGDNTVLDNVTEEIYKGDFTVIMGSSGAGKSTLLYALSCLDEITSGEIFYKGEKISGLKEGKSADLRARQFGFVFQQPQLVSDLTLYENTLVAVYTAGCDEVLNNADKLFSDMGIEHCKNRMPGEVSGGEAQRGAIARAMIKSPGILFADEPTGALNKKTVMRFYPLWMSLTARDRQLLW